MNDSFDVCWCGSLFRWSILKTMKWNDPKISIVNLTTTFGLPALSFAPCQRTEEEKSQRTRWFLGEAVWRPEQQEGEQCHRGKDGEATKGTDQNRTKGFLFQRTNIPSMDARFHHPSGCIGGNFGSVGLRKYRKTIVRLDHATCCGCLSCVCHVPM